MLVIGVDGWKRGWVAVALDDGGYRDASVHETLAGLLQRYDEAALYAIDIPIGLADRGPREADLAAKRFLKQRSSSVFLTPPRVVVERTSWEEALLEARKTLGSGISKQAFALFARIREADALVADQRVVEVHPEVSFQVLAGRPLAHRKKAWGGQMERRRLLRGAGIEIPDDLGAANEVPPDDVLDAAVAAWSGARVARGEALAFPADVEQRDASGRRIAILA